MRLKDYICVMAVLAQMTDKVRIAIIDSVPLFRSGVSQLISSLTNYELVAEGETSLDAIEIAVAEAPDIILLELGIKGGGLNTLKQIHRRAKNIKTILFTTSENEDELATAFGAGACGFISKAITELELIDVIASVQAGGTYASPQIASRYFQKQINREKKQIHPAKLLTKREHDVLEKVAEAKTNKEIALHYKITEKTVKHYMTSILQKLQVRNRVEAALIVKEYRQQNT